MVNVEDKVRVVNTWYSRRPDYVGLIGEVVKITHGSVVVKWDLPLDDMSPTSNFGCFDKWFEVINEEGPW